MNCAHQVRLQGPQFDPMGITVTVGWGTVRIQRDSSCEHLWSLHPEPAAGRFIPPNPGQTIEAWRTYYTEPTHRGGYTAVCSSSTSGTFIGLLTPTWAQQVADAVLAKLNTIHTQQPH